MERLDLRGGLWALVLGAGLLTLVAGCVPFATPSTPTVTPAEDALHVAILLPGPKDQDLWSRAGYEGLLTIQTAYNAVVAYEENVEVAKAETFLRDYAEAGYDLIVVDGGAYLEAATVVAEEYPRTTFAVVSMYRGNNRNLAGLFFDLEEMGYLSGYIAGLKTKVGHVGFVGEVPNPTTRRHVDNFVAGVQAANPEVRVTVRYATGWAETIKVARATGVVNAETTRSAFDDVVFAGADVIGVHVLPGAVDLHRAAQEKGIQTIGFYFDYGEMVPKSVLTSLLVDVHLPLLEAAQLVHQGRLEGGLYVFGLRQGAIRLAPFRDHLSPEEVAQVNRIRDDIIHGRIDVSATVGAR